MAFDRRRTIRTSPPVHTEGEDETISNPILPMEAWSVSMREHIVQKVSLFIKSNMLSNILVPCVAPIARRRSISVVLGLNGLG